MKKIFILTGESSGDKLASKVIADLNKLNSNIEYLSVGGENLKRIGIRSIYDLKEITYLGFTNVILNIFKIKNKINETVKAIKYWVPSIAASSMVIYKGIEFIEWNGDALITSLRDQSLRRIKFKNSELIEEKIIFKGTIGRIRDIEIQEKTGKIFLLTDEGAIWRLQK